MIEKIVPNEDNGKIQSIEVIIGDLKKVIEPKIHTVFKSSDDKNIGTILEKYRALKNEADIYFQENNDVIEKFISNYTSPFLDIKPDCVVCFLPADDGRRQLLLDFKEKIIGHIQNKNEIDFSEKFIKIEPLKSIKKHNLTKDDFNLIIEQNEPFSSIIIIDDVIDEGKTLDIFFEMLMDNMLIDNQTVVNMACIYNRPKQKKGINPLDVLRGWNNNNNKLEA